MSLSRNPIELPNTLLPLVALYDWTGGGVIILLYDACNNLLQPDFEKFPIIHGYALTNFSCLEYLWSSLQDSLQQEMCCWMAM